MPLTPLVGQPLPLRTVAEHRGSAEAGFFELHHAEGRPPIVLAANVDPAESDVKTLAVDAMRAALAGVDARLLPAGDDLAAAIKKSRIGIELSLPLMILALALLLAEGLLAQRFSKPMAADAALLGAGREPFKRPTA